MWEIPESVLGKILSIFDWGLHNMLISVLRYNTVEVKTTKYNLPIACSVMFEILFWEVEEAMHDI